MGKVGLVKRTCKNVIQILRPVGWLGDFKTVVAWSVTGIAAAWAWVASNPGWTMVVTIIGAFVALCFLPLIEDHIREKRVLRKHRDRRAEASRPVVEDDPGRPRVLNAPRGFHTAKYERIALERARDDVVKQVADEVRQQLREEDE